MATTRESSPRARDRDLLTALHGCPALPMAVTCRLAATLPRWRREPLSQAAPLAHEIGLPARYLRRALELRSTAGEAARQQRRQARATATELVTLADEDFPEILRRLPQPPPVLYRRGAAAGQDWQEQRAVAVIGSRRASTYGLEAAAFFAGCLAEAGITIVSGFARGIDQRAHRACLEAGGTTVAVLGCGLDVDYPRGAGELARRIASQGALISEFAPGTEPRPWHFPVRNRLIAGLCRAVLVVEATARSGSLITVRHALDLDRDVFVVPGSIFHRGSAGPYGLLRDGAYPAIHPQDVLDSLPDALAASPSPPPPELPGFAGRLFGLLPRGDAMNADELATATGKSIDETLTALLELELEGWIRRLPGGAFGRRR
ncbi:MAG: DNA-processing protein DprA [Acidobacteriota bacterium]